MPYQWDKKLKLDEIRIWLNKLTNVPSKNHYKKIIRYENYNVKFLKLNILK